MTDNNDNNQRIKYSCYGFEYRVDKQAVNNTIISTLLIMEITMVSLIPKDYRYVKYLSFYAFPFIYRYSDTDIISNFAVKSNRALLFFVSSQHRDLSSI